ncbi:EamA/RhaT family transporter [Bacillus salacetis]|uniref:EamA/RhaT family transporter n=1 Tax=Bacillus salacetis TaxID=2315464 RepID=A0A3A1R458_9BACI|nr:EamA family transporter [Bacillus salacetis]RIW37349.1 EamA/RhaT family transporter [Bacillus salacetis]
MNKTLFVILLAATTGLMGSSFAVGKLGLEFVSPLMLVALRFTIAGILMTLAVRMIRRPHPQGLKEWAKIMLVGSLQTAGVMGCIFLSLRTITAGESSILTFTNPLLVVVFGTLFMGVKYRRLQWMGVILGIVGVFITLGASLDIKQPGFLLGLMSAVFWASSTLVMKKWGKRFDTWVMTAYQMLFGGMILLLISILFEDVKVNITSTSIMIILWLAIMASVVQFAIWFYLLQNEDPAKVSSFLFLAPLFGVLTGWILLNEQLHISTLMGGSIILAGIYLVNKPQHMGAGSSVS